MINFNKYFYINEKKVGLGAKTYFIADIASNHNQYLRNLFLLLELKRSLQKQQMLLVLSKQYHFFLFPKLYKLKIKKK